MLNNTANTAKTYTGFELMRWERTLDEGDCVVAFWTNSYREYAADVRIVRINRASYRVELLEDIRDGESVLYPAGRCLNIPHVMSNRHGPGNRLWPHNSADIDRANAKAAR